MSFVRRYCVVLCIAIPWLNPFAAGPSGAVMPWLVSLACVGGLLLAARTEFLPKSFALFLGAACAVLVLQGGFNGWQNLVEVLATLLALFAVGVCAAVGRGTLTPHQFGATIVANTASHVALPSVWVTPATQLIAATWLGVALISCVFGLFQYCGVEHWFAPWVSQADDGTAYANLRQRNQFATLTGMGLLALVFLVQVRAWQGNGGHMSEPDTTHTAPYPVPKIATSWTANFATVGALLLLAAGHAATGSRTGVVQWLLLAVLGWVWRGKLTLPARFLLYLALPAYALFALVLPMLSQLAAPADAPLASSASAFARLTETSGSGRSVLYRNLLDLIALRPWLGWGWRELSYAHYSTHFEPRFGEIADNAHNLPLHLAVELGLPCALAICGVAVWGVLRAKPWREGNPTRQLAWGVLALIAVHSLTEYPLWYGPFLMATGLCLGLLCLANPVFPINTAKSHVFTAQAAILIIAFTAYASWDYHRVSQPYLSAEQRHSAYADNTLAHAQHSWLFARQAHFAQLMVSPVTVQSAPAVLNLALEMVHYSPEPRVVQALIESATALGLDDVAVFHLARFKEVFAAQYAEWSHKPPATKP